MKTARQRRRQRCRHGASAAGDRIGQLRGAGVQVDGRRVGQVAIGIVLADARRPGRRLHDRRGAHEPAGRPPPPRRRAGHLHGDGMPRAPRRQREQRSGLLVPWHLQPSTATATASSSPAARSTGRVHRARHCRAGRSRPGVTGLHRRHRALVGGRVRAAGDPGGRPAAARGAAPGAAPPASAPARRRAGVTALR